MTKVAVQSESHAGEPHVRFAEGEVASAKPNRGFRASKTIWMLLAAAAAMGVRAHAGETYYLSVGEKYVLCDASGWSTDDGRVAGGEGDPLGNEDTFVIGAVRDFGHRTLIMHRRARPLQVRNYRWAT